MPNNKWNRDCKSFPGIYACEIMTSEGYKDCSECQFYEPIGKKILIMHFGALGDVIRTTSIIPEIRRKYGKDSKITWLTSHECVFILKNTQEIDEIIPYNQEIHLRLNQEEFDVLINLEITPPATQLANITNAKEKIGYFFNKDGHPKAFNKGAEEYLEIAFSNHLNKNTKKTYQELIFNAIELEYKQQQYQFKPEINEDYIKTFKNKNNLKETDKIIGINIGSAPRFPSKAWDLEKIKGLTKELNKNYKVILLGGPNELRIKEKLKETPAITNDFANSMGEFISVLSICNLIITGDTLALHLSIALKKPTIALFFTTPPWQIENYSFLKKIVSPLMEKYFWSDQYHKDLVNSITIEEVLRECKALL